MKTGTITATTPTTIGLQTYNITGFGTPQAAMFTVGRPQVGANPTFGVHLGYGFTDGIMGVCTAAACADSNTTSSTSRANYSGTVNKYCIVVIGASGTLVARGKFDSWSANGIVVDWTEVTASVERYFTITLISGCNNVLVRTALLSTTDTVVDVGFKSNLVFATSTGSNNANLTSAHAIISFGAVHNSSTDVVTQGQVAYSHANVISGDNSFGMTANDSFVGQLHAGAITWKGSANTFTSTGFTVTAPSAGGDYIFILALDTGDTDGVDVSIIDSPTSAGTSSVTAPGWTPQAVILAMSTSATLNTLYAADPFAIGHSIFDSTYQACISFDADWNAATTNYQANFSTTNAVELYHWGGSSHDLLLQGSFDSFTANGYDLSFPTYVDTTARKFLSIAFKSAAAGGVSVSASVAWRVFAEQSINTSWAVLAETLSNTAWRVLSSVSNDSAWKVRTESSANTAWKVFTETIQDTSWKVLTTGGSLTQNIAWRVLGAIEQSTSYKVFSETQNDISWKVKNAIEDNVAWKVLAEELVSTGWRIFASGSVDTSWIVNGVEYGPSLVQVALPRHMTQFARERFIVCNAEKRVLIINGGSKLN